MNKNQQEIANILDGYFKRDDSLSLRKFSYLFFDIKYEGTDLYDVLDSKQNCIENIRSSICKWKNGSRGVSISNMKVLQKVFETINETDISSGIENIIKINEEEKKDHKAICDRISKGRTRFAWDVEQKDLIDNPFKYVDCIKSKPPFLSDEEFKELNSLYPKRGVYEEILSKEKADYSFETIKYLEKMNRFISDSSVYKDAVELWKNWYIWYDHYKTGRLYGSNILEAPRNIFENLINVWFNYYRGSSIKAYHEDYLERLGESLGLLSIEGEFDPRDGKYYIYVGHIVKYHDGRIDDDFPTFSGSIPIIHKAMNVDMGKLGDILSSCYEENISRIEATYKGKRLIEERFRVEVSSKYLARKYYEWFLDNGYRNLDNEVISYFRKNDPDYLGKNLKIDNTDDVSSYDEEDYIIYEDDFDYDFEGEDFEPENQSILKYIKKTVDYFKKNGVRKYVNA